MSGSTQLPLHAGGAGTAHTPQHDRAAGRRFYVQYICKSYLITETLDLSGMAQVTPPGGESRRVTDEDLLRLCNLGQDNGLNAETLAQIQACLTCIVHQSLRKMNSRKSQLSQDGVRPTYRVKCLSTATEDLTYQPLQRA